jgi:hypothetical protein
VRGEAKKPKLPLVQVGKVNQDTDYQIRLHIVAPEAAYRTL